MASERIRITVAGKPGAGRSDALVGVEAVGPRPKKAARTLPVVPMLTALPKVGAVDQTFLSEGPFVRGVIVSLGPAEKVEADTLRKAGAATGKWATDLELQRLTVLADELAAVVPGAPGVQVFCEGLLLGDFRFDRHRKPEKPAPRRLRVELLAATAAERRRVTAEVDRATKVAAAVNLARELSHEPANVINPATLAMRAKRIAAACGLKCRVLGEKELRARRMGAILAVGQGSATGPRLIVLEYRGRKRGARAEASASRPVVLVGKAITFDTGGYSLKPPDGMVGMKYDKCGGMAALATLQAAAALQLETPVVAVIAAAENMVSENAYRPNDIIRAMSGKTVEIISTDAEGRLVLADALTYAQQQYQPRAMIDLATLTGGVRVALGTACAGLMGNDDALADALIAAGQQTHERLWRLPLWDDYRDLIKSEDADIKNSGGRSASCITGGIFLKEFVDDKTPWAHLDIAAVADVDKDHAYCPKGATGFGVRLLVDYLARLEA